MTGLKRFPSNQHPVIRQMMFWVEKTNDPIAAGELFLANRAFNSPYQKESPIENLGILSVIITTSHNAVLTIHILVLTSPVQHFHVQSYRRLSLAID